MNKPEPVILPYYNTLMNVFVGNLPAETLDELEGDE